MEPIETIRVKTAAEDNPDGYFVINACDFDEKVHERFEGEVAVREVATLPPDEAPAEEKMTIAALRKYLNDRDIAFDPDAKKADLRALYEADAGV